MSTRQEVASALVDTAKAAPPVGVGGMTLFGHPPETWLVWATLIYTMFLLIDKLPVVVTRLRDFATWLKEFRNGRK